MEIVEIEGIADPMTAKVKSFVRSLDKKQLKQAQFTFDHKDRTDWNFVPMVRTGLPLREMNEKQREMIIDLLQTGLSEKGLAKAEAIIALEDVLTVMENREPGNDWRNPLLYYIAVFGKPGGKAPWGWRFEGHHLSLNYTSINKELTVFPAFWGTNPHKVPVGAQKGQRVLHEEEDFGWELLKSFSRAQMKKVVIAQEAFPDIVSGTDGEARIGEFEGLPASEMTPEQEQLLVRLIHLYLNNMKADMAEREWNKIRAQGLGKVHFAWAGGTKPGQKHYYRIHGPGFLVEYDLTQNEGNHLHTVWRDLDNDFGVDLLLKHRQDHDH